MSNGSGVLIVIILAIGVFFICREIITWYFKLNQIVSLLQEISAKLSELREASRQDSTVIADHINKISALVPANGQTEDPAVTQHVQHTRNPLTGV